MEIDQGIMKKRRLPFRLLPRSNELKRQTAMIKSSEEITFLRSLPGTLQPGRLSGCFLLARLEC